MSRSRSVNVCFHGIGQPGRTLEVGEAPYWISHEFFLQVLDIARDHPNATLSFDDGNSSDVELALPALAERDQRATFFTLAGRIDQPGSVSASGLRELADSGMTIGSHGMNHRPWPGMDDAELVAELEDARKIIGETVGVPVSSAACPLGRYDRRVLGRMRKLEYSQVFTSDRATARPSAWLQPRFSVRNTDDLGSIGALFSQRRTAGIRSNVLAAARITAKRWR
jgi:peptidoglycan/xylan/chitin deacetylase (PgdA/CDA1 family)